MVHLNLPPGGAASVPPPVTGFITQIQTFLSWLLTLTDKERASARSLGETNEAVAHRVAELGAQFPIFFALGHTSQEVTDLMALRERLITVSDALNGIVFKINDTMKVVDDRIFHVAHGYYSQAQYGQTENTPNADFVVNELAPFFANLGPGNGTPNPPTPPVA